MDDGNPLNIAEFALLAGFNVQALWPLNGDGAAALEEAQQPYEVLFTAGQGLLVTPDQALAAQRTAALDAYPDLEDNLYATLEDVLHGTSQQLSFMRSTPCGDCAGNVVATAPPGPVCQTCGGAGCTSAAVLEEVTILPGAPEYSLVATLTGAAGGGAGGLASVGDVELLLHVVDHPNFRRHGGSSVDLQTVKYITQAQACTGATLDVELLDGRTYALTTRLGRARWINAEVRIIADEGLPVFHGQPGERGDMYVRIVTVSPSAPLVTAEVVQWAERAALKARHAHQAVQDAAQRLSAAARAMAAAGPAPQGAVPPMAPEALRRQQVLRLRPQVLLGFELQRVRADVMSEQAEKKAALMEQLLAERDAPAAGDRWTSRSKWLLSAGVAASLAMLAAAVVVWSRQCPHGPVQGAPSSSAPSAAAPSAPQPEGALLLQ